MYVSPAAMDFECGYVYKTHAAIPDSTSKFKN